MLRPWCKSASQRRALQLYRPNALILQPQQLDELVLIETDHRLAVDQSHRRALETRVKQFLQRGFVRPNVFLDKLNALLR